MPILNWMPLARARFQHAVRCRCPGSQRALPDSEDPSREAWLGRREPRETGSDRGRPQVVPTGSCAQCKDRGALPLPPTSAGTTQVRAGADRLRWHLSAKDGVGPSIPTARGGQGAGVPPLHPFPQPTEGRLPGTRHSSHSPPLEGRGPGAHHSLSRAAWRTGVRIRSLLPCPSTVPC